MNRFKDISFLCFWSLVVCLSAQAQIYLPPYDPVYEDLRYLQVGGTLGSIDLNQVPVLSDQLIETVRSDLRSELISQPQRFLLNQIRTAYTFGDTGQSSGLLNRLLEKVFVNSVKEPQFYLGMQTDITAVTDPGKLYPELRTFGAVILPYGISVVNVMTIDPYATENPDYIGKEWRGLSGYTEQAYFLWQTKFSRFTFGRSFIINGPGRNSNLMFSGAARPMNQMRLEFINRRFNYQTIIAQLDPIADADRYLSSHRLTVYLKRLQLSVTETILYGGVNQRLEFAYLNPFLFFHGEQMNGPGLNGNTLGSVELTYSGNKWCAYTEILIDDIQLDKEEPGDLEPDEIGIVVGFDLVDPFGVEGLYVGAEYSALTNRTYKTASPYEFYIHRNVPIGYPLGSDLDCWDLVLKKYLQNWQAIIRFDYLRRGAGEMNVLWDMPWMNNTVEQGYDEPFPTGIVEKTADIGLELRWLPTYNRYAFLRLNLQNIQNIAHTTDNEQNVVVTIGLHWDFKFVIGDS